MGAEGDEGPSAREAQQPAPPRRPPRHKRAAPPPPPPPPAEVASGTASGPPQQPVTPSCGVPSDGEMPSRSESRASVGSCASSGLRDTATDEQPDLSSPSRGRRVSATSPEPAERRASLEAAAAAPAEANGHPHQPAVRPARRRRAPAPPPPPAGSAAAPPPQTGRGAAAAPHGPPGRDVASAHGGGGGGRLPAVGLAASTGPRRAMALPSSDRPSDSRLPTSPAPAPQPAVRRWLMSQQAPPPRPPPPNTEQFVPPPPGFDDDDDDLDIDTTLFARKRRAPPPPAAPPLVVPPPPQQQQLDPEPKPKSELEQEPEAKPELELHPESGLDPDPEPEPEPAPQLPLTEPPRPAPRSSLSRERWSTDSDACPEPAVDHQASSRSKRESVSSSEEVAPVETSADADEKAESLGSLEDAADHSPAGDGDEEFWKEERPRRETLGRGIKRQQSVHDSLASTGDDRPESLASSPLETFDSESLPSSSRRPSLEPSHDSSRHQSLAASPEPVRRSSSSSHERARNGSVSSIKYVRRSAASSPERPRRLSASLQSTARALPSSPEPRQRSRTVSIASSSLASETRGTNYQSEPLSDHEQPHSAGDTAGSQSEDVFGEFESEPTASQSDSGTRHFAVVDTVLRTHGSRRNGSQGYGSETASESDEAPAKRGSRLASPGTKAASTNIQTASLAAVVRESQESGKTSADDLKRDTEPEPSKLRKASEKVVKMTRWTPPKVQLGSWTGYSPGHKIQLMEDEDYVFGTGTAVQRPSTERRDSWGADMVGQRPSVERRDFSGATAAGQRRPVERKDSSGTSNAFQHPQVGRRDSSGSSVADRPAEWRNSASLEQHTTTARSPEVVRRGRTNTRSASPEKRLSGPWWSPERETGINYVISAERATARSAERVRFRESSERSSRSPEGRIPHLHHVGNGVRHSPERTGVPRAGLVSPVPRGLVSPVQTDHEGGGDVTAPWSRRSSGTGDEVTDPSRESSHVTGVTGRRGSGGGGFVPPTDPAESQSALFPGRHAGLFKRTAFAVPAGWKMSQPVVKGFRSVPAPGADVSGASGPEAHSRH